MMKSIILSVVSVFLVAAVAIAQFVQEDVPAVPATTNRILSESFQLAEGETITLTATNRPTRTLTVPAGKTATIRVLLTAKIQ